MPVLVVLTLVPAKAGALVAANWMTLVPHAVGGQSEPVIAIGELCRLDLKHASKHHLRSEIEIERLTRSPAMSNPERYLSGKFDTLTDSPESI